MPRLVSAHDDRLDFARDLIRAEADALRVVADRLDDSFLRAVDLLLPLHGAGRGRLAISGTGKSSDIGLKLSGTLNSTGTRAYVLDATKAVHGDLGMLHPDDVALVLSHSGESDEIVRLLPPLRSLCRAIIGLTGNANSTLARKSDIALVYGPLDEVCPLGLAPSASTTAMLAVGDALAFSLSRSRDFSRDDFARYHPAGSLGKKLAPVETVMRCGPQMRTAAASATVREVFAQAKRSGRRSGAVILIGDDGRLAGIFTDSDLARLIETRRDDALDRPIAEVMISSPRTVSVNARVGDAMDIFQRLKISELPVVNDKGQAVGLIDITDLIGVAALDVEEAPVERPLRKGA